MKMTDMYPTKYLKAEDFPKHRILTIKSCVMEEVGMEKTKQPVVYFNEGEKGLVLNKTNASFISHTHGDDSDSWPGKTIEVRKDITDYQGKVVDCIRVKGVKDPVASQGNPSPEVVDDDLPF